MWGRGLGFMRRGSGLLAIGRRKGEEGARRPAPRLLPCPAHTLPSMGLGELPGAVLALRLGAGGALWTHSQAAFPITRAAPSERERGSPPGRGQQADGSQGPISIMRPGDRALSLPLSSSWLPAGPHLCLLCFRKGVVHGDTHEADREGGTGMRAGPYSRALSYGATGHGPPCGTLRAGELHPSLYCLLPAAPQPPAVAAEAVLGHWQGPLGGVGGGHNHPVPEPLGCGGRSRAGGQPTKAPDLRTEC